MAAAACRWATIIPPKSTTVTAGRLPGRNQEGVYDPNHCGVTTPDTWTLLLHLKLNCLESGTWKFASPGTSDGAVTAPAMFGSCSGASMLSGGWGKGRESAAPERKALPRMLKAAEGIASPPPHYRHTHAGRCRKRGASGIMTHPPCTQAVSLPPLRPEVEKHQTHNRLLSTDSYTVDLWWSPLTQAHILVRLPLWGHM